MPNLNADERTIANRAKGLLREVGGYLIPRARHAKEPAMASKANRVSVCMQAVVQHSESSNAEIADGVARFHAWLIQQMPEEARMSYVEQHTRAMIATLKSAETSL